MGLQIPILQLIGIANFILQLIGIAKTILQLIGIGVPNLNPDWDWGSGLQYAIHWGSGLQSRIAIENCNPLGLQLIASNPCQGVWTHNIQINLTLTTCATSVYVELVTIP